MAAINQDITLYQGDHLVLEVLVHKANGDNVAVDSLSARYAMAKKSNSTPLFMKSSDEDGEIVITTKDNTLLLQIHILPEDTLELSRGYYYHEVELFDTEDQRPYTVMVGKVTIVNTVILPIEDSEE